MGRGWGGGERCDGVDLIEGGQVWYSGRDGDVIRRGLTLGVAREAFVPGYGCRH